MKKKELKAEIARLMDREKRIRRVYWRVVIYDGPTHHSEEIASHEFDSRKEAHSLKRKQAKCCALFLRVTVRSRAKSPVFTVPSGAMSVIVTATGGGGGGPRGPNPLKPLDIDLSHPDFQVRGPVGVKGLVV